MVQVRCLRCGGKAEGKNAKEAEMRIDHGVGLSIGKPCKGFPHARVETIGESEKPVEKPKEKVTIVADEVEIETKSEEKPKKKKKSKKDS